MSDGIVPAAQFSPTTGIDVLFFTGLSLPISNLYGVPASTSLTAVGAIVGFGLATGYGAASIDQGILLAVAAISSAGSPLPVAPCNGW